VAQQSLAARDELDAAEMTDDASGFGRRYARLGIEPGQSIVFGQDRWKWRASLTKSGHHHKASSRGVR
jgi:hypothetical protein